MFINALTLKNFKEFNFSILLILESMKSTSKVSSMKNYLKIKLKVLSNKTRIYERFSVIFFMLNMSVYSASDCK